jgi:methylmalonyl-CoA mutase
VEQTLLALQAGARGTENLLELSVDCLGAGATVGEVSETLAAVFGRYAPRSVTVGGVYGRGYTDAVEWQALTERVRAFERQQGRRPRLLVAKLGQDGHDRGAKVIASGFVDLGFDVDLGPLFQTPEEVARIALDHDVHVVGISTQAGAHRTLIPELIEQLRLLGGQHIRVVCGGIVPEQDRAGLEAAGVSAIFPPGTAVTDAASSVLDLLEATGTSSA